MTKQVRKFVDDFQQRIRDARTEAELRDAFSSSAATVLELDDLRLERERQDLRRNRVIIEFKKKGEFGGRRGAVYARAVEQLADDYIPAQAAADGAEADEYFGVCFDGKHFGLVSVESGGVRCTDLEAFNERTASTLVEALVQDERRSLTPENVIDDFGPESVVAARLVSHLYAHLRRGLDAGVNRIEMLYSEWKDLFEQTANLGTLAREQLQDHAEALGVPPDADPGEVLFCLHTYHALVFKALAAELVLANTLIEGMQSEFCFETAALEDDKLVKTLAEEIEESRLFQRVNILNFVEGSFFTWYLEGPDAELVAGIRDLLNRVALYRLTALDLSETRDIVKRLYQDLVPGALRHNIGEYFTPEWLVDFVLDRVGYKDEAVLDAKILDPCCGSGNFLIHEIDRFKAEAREVGWPDERLLTEITQRIFGFDLNPLAVLTARVNYLIALSDLLATHQRVEIPVYQADAVYAPSIDDDDDEKELRSYTVNTREHRLDITLPEELIRRSDLFAQTLAEMEASIVAGETADEFMERVVREVDGFSEAEQSDDWEPHLRQTFADIEFLEQAEWDRIWCRIIRNYFASVAIGRCDFIAGNPPWVRWSELPDNYRERIKDVCEGYGIFSEDKFFGGNELDISGMILYSTADKWLMEDGRLSYVITQTHFQAPSSGGFRDFAIDEDTPLGVERVDDFVDVRPFAGVSNKPAVVTLDKNQPTTYPVAYYKWDRTTRELISEDATWAEANPVLSSVKQEAHALARGNRWSILAPNVFPKLKGLEGPDPALTGRKGVTTDLNGAYFIKLLGTGSAAGTARFENLPEKSRKDVPSYTGEIDLDVVYPLIKGASDVQAFYASPVDYNVIVPNRGITAGAVPTVSQMRAAGHTRTLRYFNKMNSDGLVDDRSTWRTRHRATFDKAVESGNLEEGDIPYYAIYNVGDYTFAPYKVVWAEMAGTIEAAVIGSADVPYGGGRKPIVPDHKIYFAAFDDADVAHYVCAMLNSEPVRTFIDAFTVKLQVGSLFRDVKLPAYDPADPICQRLVLISRRAHRGLAAREGNGEVPNCRRVINRLAGELLK